MSHFNASFLGRHLTVLLMTDYKAWEHGTDLTFVPRAFRCWNTCKRTFKQSKNQKKTKNAYEHVNNK